MLLPFILLLLPITSQQTVLDTLRKSRQLDLGLQDVSSQNEKTPETIDAVNNGYLPPPSSKPVGAQSQQTLNFESPNVVEDLSPKSVPTDGFIKPSRNLVPPFNDLSHGSVTKTKEPTTDFSVFSAVSASTFSSTTRRPVSKATVAVETLKHESTNENRSYLPPQPEFSAAAQTASVSVVKPEQEDHHHHHHHHGDDFDICSDAFHSFLCAPLKARKRITGALPNRLSGQSSFLQPQRVLPNPDKEPASSNTFRNEYLPPAVPASATNRIVSTLPPTTTRRPTTTTRQPPVPKPSNEENRFYLPPVTENKLFAQSNRVDNTIKISSPKPTPTFATPSSPKSQFSSVFVSTTQRTSPPQRYTPEASLEVRSSTQPPIISTFAQEDRFYLPPNPNPQPAASFVSSTKQSISSVSTFKPSSPSFISTISPLPTISTFAPLPSNSIFLSSQPKFQPTPIPSTLRTITPVTFIPQSTSSPAFVSSIKPLPSISTFVPLPSSSVFISPQPKIQPVSNVISTTVKPGPTTLKLVPQSSSNFVTTAKPFVKPTFVPLLSNSHNAFVSRQPKFQSASNIISTTIKPRPKPSNVDLSYHSPSTSKFVPQPTQEDRSYLPPEPNVQPAAAQLDVAVAAPQQNNPFHHGRDLCTDPFHSFLCVPSKPRKRITGALPNGFRPDSSNVNEQRLKPAPTFQNENRVNPNVLEAAQAQTVGYQYPKPSPTIPNPSTGYSYPKPDKEFPLPSQQNVIRLTTKKPILETSEARTVIGYDYPKPVNPFPLPSDQGNVKIPTSEKPTTRYDYPKPQKPLVLPTEQKEVKKVLNPSPAPTNQVIGYDYPKPVNPFPSPSSQDNVRVPTTVKPSTGYDYPKPQKPLVLPTEQREVKVGYQYPKPQPSFDLPAKTGYSYPKPERRLDLPSEGQSKTLLPQSNSKIDPLSNLGSAEFIPVNKLDAKREESRGTKRFGERLRKRSRRPEGKEI